MSDNTWIKRIKVDHYGPLGDIDVELDEGMNVFYGKNESGKTLLVEAVTKMLLDDSSSFADIGRVSQDPAGMLLMETGGEELEVSQEDLNTVFQDVTASDVRNSFLIRDFDLRLPERQNDFGKGNYFNDVTDRVLGSKTNKIQGVREEIADFSYLTNSTPSSKIENRKSTGHLRKKKEEAEGLKDEIEEAIAEIREEGLVEKYSEIETLQKQVEKDKNRIETLENARKQQKYQQGKEIISKVREIEDDLEELREEEEKLDQARELKQRAESFEPVKISGYSFFRKASIATTVTTLIGLVATIITSNPIPAAVAGLAFLVSIYTGYRYFKTRKEMEESDMKKEKILEQAEAKGLEAENLADVTEEFKDWRESIDSRKNELKEERGELAGTFRAEFNTDAEDLEKWKKILDEFSESFETVEEDYSEGDIEELEADLNENQDELEQLEDDISRFDSRFNDFDSRLSTVLRLEFLEDEPVSVEVFEDLEEAERQLQEFLDNIEEMKKSSHEALEILVEMEEEEEDEFNRIFSDGSYAVEMFKEATDGNYTDINYDKDERVLKVERSDGTVLTPDQLSQGTYDLLYMAVRLKLAREILGEPGFLILDTAFVHSDIDRVQKELEFLQKLEDDGWQIIYFTFRDDVKEQLEELTTVRELEDLEFE